MKQYIAFDSHKQYTLSPPIRLLPDHVAANATLIGTAKLSTLMLVKLGRRAESGNPDRLLPTSLYATLFITTL